MSWTRRAAGLAAALVAVPFLARPARADIHGWTLCTPGGFHSCHSVEIGTTALTVANVRVGTGVTVKITNLQGSGFGGDNTTLSGLLEIIFSSQHLSNVFTLQPITSSAVGTGSSGSASWTAETGTQAPIGGYLAGYPSSNNAIGGCASGSVLFNNYTTTANTCGFSAFAVFSFTTGNIFDAGQFDALFIEAAGPTDVGFCYSNPAVSDPSFPACDVFNEYKIGTAPEPVTMALMGTGLFGIGGVRLRRRRKTTTR